MSRNIRVRHRQCRALKPHHPETSISSPGDINISSASFIALVASSSCPSPPRLGQHRPRARHSLFSHISKHEAPYHPSTADSTLKTLFVRSPPKDHTPASILNNTCVSCDGATKCTDLYVENDISKVSALDSSEATESESEDIIYLPRMTKFTHFDVRESDNDDLAPHRIVTSRNRGVENIDKNIDLAHHRIMTSRNGRVESKVDNDDVAQHRMVASQDDAVESNDDQVHHRMVTSRNGVVESNDDLDHHRTVTSQYGAVESNDHHDHHRIVTSRNGVVKSNGDLNHHRMVTSQDGAVDSNDDHDHHRMVTSRNGIVESNEYLVHLLSATPSAQDMESLLLEGSVLTTRGRKLSRRRFGEKRETPGDDALHAASRLDKKLRYLDRETKRMHEDLERLLLGYKTMKTQETHNKQDSSQLSSDLRDVTLLSEMVATLERQLDRMTMRRWLGNSRRSSETLASFQ